MQDPGFFRTLVAWFASVPGSLSKWPYYCLLPVLIGVIVAMGYDTRYYRAVMVEECNKDYIRTAAPRVPVTAASCSATCSATP